MDSETARTFATLLRTDRARDCVEAADAEAEKSGDPLAIAYRGIARGRLGEHVTAVADLRDAAAQAAGVDDRSVEAFARHYLGLTLCARGENAAGYLELERAVELGNRDEGLLTGLCEVANRLGRTDAARDWGAQALREKDAKAECPDAERIAAARPKPFDPGAKRRNVIAYTLFGDDRYYHECALTTARHAGFVYPEFTARFYCASSIPRPILLALAATGADVRTVNAPAGPFYAPLMWRFLAFDDPEVDVVLVRDVDSPLMPRERAAIDLWLASEAPFHVLRDNVQHTAPMLAGLWGGFTGLLPRLEPVVRRYLGTDTTRHCDQNFLRLFVWPRIRDVTLAIDSVYSLRNSVDFPPSPPANPSVHVGCSWLRSIILGKG